MTASSSDRTPLPTQYAPREVEGPLYKRWVERGYFTADNTSDKPPYCIVIPPPNVTGSLHLGHALEPHAAWTSSPGAGACRATTCCGCRAWTTRASPRRTSSSGSWPRRACRRHDLGREAFVERVWQWKAEYGGKILDQMRRLGEVVDWSRERFTMDEGLSQAVQTIFKMLYDDGLIYRAERIINWCPRCMTALSDIEVEHSDDDGELISIRYGDGDALDRRGDDAGRDDARRHRGGRAP